jgi:hypothetical protein
MQSFANVLVPALLQVQDCPPHSPRELFVFLRLPQKYLNRSVILQKKLRNLNGFFEDVSRSGMAHTQCGTTPQFR